MSVRFWFGSTWTTIIVSELIWLSWAGLPNCCACCGFVTKARGVGAEDEVVRPRRGRGRHVDPHALDTRHLAADHRVHGHDTADHDDDRDAQSDEIPPRQGAQHGSRKLHVGGQSTEETLQVLSGPTLDVVSSGPSVRVAPPAASGRAPDASRPHDLVRVGQRSAGGERRAPTLGVRPRPARRRRGVRDARRLSGGAVRLDPPRRSAAPLRAGLGLAVPDAAALRRAADAVLDADGITEGRVRITVTGRSLTPRVRARRGPGDGDRGGRGGPAPPGRRGGGHRAVAVERAWRDRRPEDGLLRRERPRARLRPRARRHGGGVRQHPRRALRGDGFERVRRRRRRGVHAACRRGVPPRRHSRVGPRARRRPPVCPSRSARCRSRRSSPPRRRS